MNRLWRRLSRRERVLAGLTGSLVLAGAVLFTANQAWQSLSLLNRRIANLEQELMNLKTQAAQSAYVDEAFRAVAAEHSSAWTREEIHDRLRREVYRLALWHPPAPESGALLPASREDYMIQIPNLQEGSLTDRSEEGYREYHITINIPRTSFHNVVKYLERLQTSPHSLRIDELHLMRSPESTMVATSLRVTRTVVDSAGEAASVLLAENLMENGGFESWDQQADSPAGWKTEGIRVTRAAEFATEGEWCLRADVTNNSASIAQPRRLECGRPYRLRFDMASPTAVSLSISGTDGTMTWSDGDGVIGGDQQLHRYEVLFTTPGQRGTECEMCVPVLSMNGQGARMYLDNVHLTPAEG